MLKTFNRADWKEDPVAECARNALTKGDGPEKIRPLYPYRAIVTKAAKVYDLKVGQEIAYARTRCIPQFYPIEVLTTFEDGTPRKVCMGGEEVQLIEA